MIGGRIYKYRAIVTISINTLLFSYIVQFYNMCVVEEYYYTIINRFFLKVLGIWPYDRLRLVLLQRILIIISTVTFICMQVIIDFYNNGNVQNSI